MIIDSRELQDGAVVEADLCIVGAGAAGITLAREFIGHSTTVAIVESGGLELEDETQSLYEGRVSGFPYRYPDTMRLRYFGGSTNHWSGNCRPLDEEDFLHRPWLPYSGWPFGRNDLIPFYQRAQAVCGLQAFDYAIESWMDETRLRNLPFDPQKLLTGIKHISAPVRFGTAYRDELEDADNVTVYKHGNLTEIEATENATHVTGLQCRCLTGTRFRVRTSIYMLATGGIENARHLLVSDAVQPEGLGNGHGRVGRFFMDHPHGIAGWIVFRKRFNIVDLYQAKIRRNAFVKGVVTMSPQLLSGEGLSNIYFNLAASMSRSEGEKSVSALLQSFREGEVPDDLLSHLGNIIADLDDVGEAAYHRMTDNADPFNKLRVHCRIEPTPDPDSRVTLTSDRDALGMRRIDLHWKPGDLALKSYNRGVEILALEVGRTGLGRMQVQPAGDSGWPDRFEPSGHHIGTTRMHAGPEKGVVDANCRVHDIDNLYIAGSSVFPTAGCNNPTLTVVALALRLADHIKNRS